MHKSLLSLVLIGLIVSLSLFGTVRLSTAQIGTSVKGTISSDTTWTQAKSPYNLMGTVNVASGVILTIEAGTVVNLNGTSIIVNGTLNANGSATNNIQFNGGNLNNGVSLAGSDGQSIISNSIFTGQIIAGGSSTISNNFIIGRIDIKGGSQTIENNTVLGSFNADGIDFFDSANAYALISGNVISSSWRGIAVTAGSSAVIERNLLYNNTYAIVSGASSYMNTSGSNTTILNNTVTDNVGGISVIGSFSPTIMSNNIQNNSQYSLSLAASKSDINATYNWCTLNVTATYNWWGTTNTTIIGQTILDSNYNSPSGTVTFVPVLNAPNPQAPTYPKTWIVDPQGTGDFMSIQAAINASAPGDTIYVKSGTYCEHPLITKTLTLIGQSATSTIIDGQGQNRTLTAPGLLPESIGSILAIVANGVTINGFTIQNSVSDGSAIWLQGYNYIMIQNNIVANNSDGIRILNSTGNIISGNTLRNNSNTSLGFDASYNNSVVSNYIANNNIGIGAGIPSYNNTISYNNMTGNNYGFYLAIYNSTFFGNNFNNNVQVAFYGTYPNNWDNGASVGGNFWSDYRTKYPNATQIGTSRIGNTPYVIDSNNKDNYPLWTTQEGGPSPSPAPTPTSHNPTITLNPSVGQVGTGVVATVTGFPAYVSILFTFGTINGTQNVGTLTSSSGGGTVQFNVPQVPNGMYNVSAIGSQGGFATATFFVGQTLYPTPTPTLSPTTTPTPTQSPTPTPTPAPTPTLPAPTVTVSCQSSAFYSNFKVDITGTLSGNGIGIANAPILLSISVDEGKSWTGLTTAGTDNSGNFAAVWFPSASGIYLLNARWDGNSSFSDANTTINFAVLPYQEQSVFSVSSNSTISAFAFNSTSHDLSFSVSGPSGTTGYVDIYVPKTLIGDASILKVSLDGNKLEYTIASQGDSWLLSFTYHHSIHQVTINLGTATSVSSTQSQTEELVVSAAAITAILVVAVVLILRKRKSKN